jgi:hypothetical protein
MSKSIINPLLDATMMQLTAIRNLLADTPSAIMIDAAKAQLTATKQMLNIDNRPTASMPVRRDSAAFVDERARADAEVQTGQLELRPQAKAKVKPKAKTKKRSYDKNSGTKKERMKDAMLDVLSNAKAPMGRSEIEAKVQANASKYGIDFEVNSAIGKPSIIELHREGKLEREGQTSAVVYTVKK